MIKAHHSVLARSIFNPYLERLLKKNFTNFFLLNSFPEIESTHSLIITPNHFSWWDGFFIDYFIRKLTNRKIHIMMLEDQLKRYWFFRFVGAYSINQSNSKSIIQTINYTKEVLADKNNVAVIYPQGKFEIYEKRPLELKHGLQLFTRNITSETSILIVNFKIQYFDKKKPAILVRIGKLLKAEDINKDFSIYENAFYHNLKMLDEESLLPDFSDDLLLR